MSQVTLFEHAQFHGAHKHVFDAEPNLFAADDKFFNDRVSSCVVHDGEWALFRHANYVGQYAGTLRPGRFPSVTDIGVENDDMSSLRVVVSTPPLLAPHAILFEHAGFHGAHKHVFGPEANLAASDDNFFNDRVSSIVVVSGQWALFRHAGFVSRYAQTLGPGAYPSVQSLDIENDDMSSLQPTSDQGLVVLPHAILFEHADLRGAHRHVFGPEANLGASDDNFFNDRVSSIVVVSGQWTLFRHANFVGQYAMTLGPGIYRWIGALDIENDDMSSLRPV